MSQQSNRITKVDVGTPSHEFKSQDSQEWKAVDVRFHGFETLPAGRGECVASPAFACLGRQWVLRLFPGGHVRSDDGNVALYFYHWHSERGERAKIQFGLNVKSKHRIGTADFSSVLRFSPERSTPFRGTLNFATRSAIIGALVEGALIIEVRMMQTQPGTAPRSSLAPFIIDHPTSKTILRKFMDEESSDVIFKVVGEKVTTAESKRVKASTTTFHAHQLILQTSSTFFAELFDSENHSATILISDVKPAVFHHLLYYIYGGKLEDAVFEENAREIIDAADRYGVVNLKLEAEANLIASTAITTENVMELILYSNEKNCALLKETAIDYIVNHRNEVLREVSFVNFPGHLTRDVLMAENMDPSLRVDALRKSLYEKGLNIDGSREAMIARLGGSV